jgi:23S rRNA pseudouridine1911/1915/1917 synthase
MTQKPDSERDEYNAQEERDERNYPAHVEHIYTYTITAGQQPRRLDAYLTDTVPHVTRTKVQRAIEDGHVVVNDKPVKVSRKILPGDVITVRMMRLPPPELLPEDIPLDILYEDDTVLVVNKAAGMVTHPSFGHRYGTLVNAVLWHFGARKATLIGAVQGTGSMGEDDDDEGDSDSDDNDNSGDTPDAPDNEHALYASDVVRPGIVHRLDKDTSGILVVSKQTAAHPKLAEQFAKRTAKREYYALVWGRMKDDAGVIEGDIGRSPRNRKLFAVVKKDGKPAATEFRVVERFQHLTLLALKLRTGRTHQIRVHCAHRHHPLFGDQSYGGDVVVFGGEQPRFRQMAQRLLAQLPRQALHARMLGFTHPFSRQWMEFASELPADFQAVLDALREAGTEG